jgi:hypothetical protein
MIPKKKKGRKERLKPLSLYGHDPKDVIKAFMQVDPAELRRIEKEEQAKWEESDIHKEQRGFGHPLQSFSQLASDIIKKRSDYSFHEKIWFFHFCFKHLLFIRIG